MAGRIANHNAIDRRRTESGRLGLGPTPDVSSAYARYIGRVGALAVALGIGAVVVTGNGLGVAHAQDGAVGNDTSAVDGPSDPTGVSTGEPTTDGQGSDNDNTAEPNAGAVDAEVHVESSGGQDTSVNDRGQSTDADLDGDATPGDDVAEEAPATKDPTPLPDPTPIPPAGKGSTNPAPQRYSTPLNIGPGSADVHGADIVKSKQESTSTTTVTRTAVSLQSPMSLTSSFDDDRGLRSFSADESGAAMLTQAAATPQAGLQSLPGAVVQLLTSVVSAFLTPFLSPGPGTPAEPPLLFAILAFVRNEFQRGISTGANLFNNQTPTAVPDAITTSQNTPKTFNAATLLANDTNEPGEALKITAWSNPAHGSVKRNADGTFTYTPDANFSGTDTFTYTVSDEDNPFHIHFFAKSYDEPGHTATGTVTVTVTGLTVGNLAPITPLTEAGDDGYRLATFPSSGQGNNLGGGQTDAAGNLYVPVGNQVLIYGPDNQPKAVANLPFVAADVAPGQNGDYIYAVDRSLADCATCAPMTPKKLVRGVDGNYTVDPTFQLETFPYGGVERVPEGFRIATDAEGNLYVAQGVWTQKPFNTVIKYDTDGKYVTRFGEFISGGPTDASSWEEGKFWGLSGIAVSPDGNTVYTTEITNNRVQRWDSAEGINYSFTDVWGSSQANDGDRNPDTGPTVELLAPYDIGLDAAGNVYVMSTSDAKIVKYTPDGDVKIIQMYVGGNTEAFTPGKLGHGIAVTAHGDAISVQTGRMMQLVTP